MYAHHVCIDVFCVAVVAACVFDTLRLRRYAALASPLIVVASIETLRLRHSCVCVFDTLRLRPYHRCGCVMQSIRCACVNASSLWLRQSIRCACVTVVVGSIETLRLRQRVVCHPRPFEADRVPRARRGLQLLWRPRAGRGRDSDRRRCGCVMQSMRCDCMCHAAPNLSLIHI